MREMLANYVGEKIYLTGEVGRTGKKLGYKKDKLQMVESLVLKDICDLNNNYVTDHVWVKFSRHLFNAGVNEGSKIRFRATVKRYIKNNKGNPVVDYGLFYLSKVETI